MTGPESTEVLLAEPSPNGELEPTERREWPFRAIAGVLTFLFLWFAWRERGDMILSLFLIFLGIGGTIATLRLPVASGRVNSIENWLRPASARAAARQGKFSRFFQRPFFAGCLAIWRWTASLPDPHLQAAVRLTALISLCATAAVLLVTAVYLIVGIVIALAVLALCLWLLSVWAGGGSSGTRTRITRHTTDWLGHPKQEHFDSSGNKVGESKASSDWLGRPKMVNSDAMGKVVGESRPDTDWLGNPKTVHTDAEGNRTGESRPDMDWLGQPKTVHTDAEGNVVGESREETDIFGRRQTVRYDKQ
jgi:hypothetical protein